VVSKGGVVVGGIILACLLGLVIRMWWANTPPDLPNGMPKNSVWIEPPPAPFETSKRGYWLGCWQDKTTSSPKCRLTDTKGQLLFEDNFVPYGDSERVFGLNDLKLQKVLTTEMWVFLEDGGVPIVHLKNGTMLIPASKYAAVKMRLDDR
jgi:hypothetical protein